MSAEVSAGRPKVNLQDEKGYMIFITAGGLTKSPCDLPGGILKELKSRHIRDVRGRAACKASLYIFEANLDNDGNQTTFLMDRI